MTNDFYGVTLVLSHTPTHERVSEIAEQIANQHFEDESFGYKLSNTIPNGIAVDAADQLLAEYKNAPEGAIFLWVYPT